MRADGGSCPDEMSGRSTSPIPPCDDLRGKLEAMSGKAREFDGAIKANMESLKGVAIPGFNLPWWVKLLPFKIHFRKCSETKIKVREDDFLRCLEEGGVIPSQHLVAPEIWNDIANANFCRAYELRGWGCVFHVYSIFVSHVADEEKDGAKRLVAKPANARVYGTLADFIKWWKGHLEKPNCTCLTVGSFGGWDESKKPEELHSDSIQVLSSPCDDGTWEVRHNSLEHISPVYRTLVYRLYPESRTRWYGRICEILHDEFQNDPHAATMTPSRMKDKVHIPQDCIEEIFEDLRRNNGEWRSARDSTDAGELGLLPADGKRGDGSFMRGNARFQWIAVGIATATLVVTSVILGFVISNFKQKNYLWAVASAVALYLFRVVASNLERRFRE